MKNSLVLLTIVCIGLAFVADATTTCGGTPPQNCDDLCFCPCRIPGGTTQNLIYPSDDCLARIKCTFGSSECSDEVMACQKPNPKEICFCPCRIPGCKPEVLYYPSQKCLQRIRCTFGQYECSAAYLAGNQM